MSKTQLYRWYDKDDNLLYVGISYSAMVRASQHKVKSNDGWYDLAVKSTTENFESRTAAAKAESNAIKTENPKHNLARKTTKNTQPKKKQQNIKLQEKCEDEFDVYMLKYLLEIVDVNEVASGCVLDVVNQEYFFSDSFRDDIVTLKDHHNLVSRVRIREMRVEKYMQELFQQGVNYGINLSWLNFTIRSDIYSEDDLALCNGQIVNILGKKFHHVPERHIKFSYKNRRGNFYPKIGSKTQKIHVEMGVKLFDDDNSNFSRKYRERLINAGLRYFSEYR